MTTTAAAWRHVEEHNGVCVGCGRSDNPYQSLCNTPTPDPGSPCGWRGRDGSWRTPCVEAGTAHATLLHPHHPTRCTCGHALEAVR